MKQLIIAKRHFTIINKDWSSVGRTIAPVFFISATQLLSRYIAATVHCIAQLGKQSKELKSSSLIVLMIQVVHRATSLLLSCLFIALIAGMLAMGIAMAVGYYLLTLNPKGLWYQAGLLAMALTGSFHHPKTITHG